MNKIFGVFSLVAINSSVLYLIYLYVYIACSVKVDNFFHIPYEPSGTQLFFYILSLPIFLILGVLSLLHSYYYETKSLCSGILIIWASYFILILFIDMIIHFSEGNNLLYYGTLSISLIAIFYVICSTYYQFIQLIKSNLT